MTVFEPNDDFIEFKDIKNVNKFPNGVIISHRRMSFSSMLIEVLLLWDVFTSWIPISHLHDMNHSCIKSYKSKLESSELCLYDGVHPRNFCSESYSKPIFQVATQPTCHTTASLATKPPSSHINNFKTISKCRHRICFNYTCQLIKKQFSNSF